MLDAYHLAQVVQRVKLLVIKLAKCRYFDFYTQYLITITVLYLPESNRKKDGSGDWPGIYNQTSKVKSL
jgi:hypothetical protein